MASLGEFGAALAALDTTAPRDDFTFLGERFDVVGDIPPMLMLQLGAAVSGKIDESEGLAAMWEALRCSLDAPKVEGREPVEQFNRLVRLAVDRRADMDGIMRLVFALFEAQSGRPTVAAPGSQPGPHSISPSARASSTHPELAHLTPLADILAG